LRQLLAITLCLLLLAVAGCSDKTTNPDPIMIKNGTRYFPVQQGNKWFYNGGEYVRSISGDTTVAGVSCLRLMQNGETEEAWTLTSERFAQHLLAQFLWFDPPLQIPLNLQKDKPYQTTTLGKVAPGWDSPIDSVRFEGTVTFTGYVQKEVVDVMKDSCIGLHYSMKSTIYNHTGLPSSSTDSYEEYYAPGIGMVLLDDPRDQRYLDSAIINGVKVP
jgi:hypothetical protein